MDSWMGESGVWLDGWFVCPVPRGVGPEHGEQQWFEEIWGQNQRGLQRAERQRDTVIAY